jgi:hypothetical protein
MKLTMKLVLMAGIILSENQVFSQITKSLYIPSPCIMTLVSSAKEGNSETDFIIFPNPNDGTFKIKFISKPQFEEFNLTIVNEFGALVLSCRKKISENQADVDIKGFTPGIYMIRIVTGKETLIKKFMITF